MINYNTWLRRHPSYTDGQSAYQRGLGRGEFISGKPYYQADNASFQLGYDDAKKEDRLDPRTPKYGVSI